MSGHLAFWGSAGTDDAAALSSVITEWVGVEGRSKSRVTGTETTWDSGDVEVFAYPDTDVPDAPSQYLLEGRVPGPAADGRKRLLTLLNALTERVGDAGIDYQERDENDEDVGDLQSL
jgi:hypothetical protein